MDDGAILKAFAAGTGKTHPAFVFLPYADVDPACIDRGNFIGLTRQNARQSDATARCHAGWKASTPSA